MKFGFAFVFLCLCIAACVARPSSSDVAIVKQDAEVLPDGYKFGYETSDGSSRTEEGQLKNAGTDDEAIVVHGTYSYVGDDGVTYTVNFTADENGYQPEGSHLPHA